jgi:hypothetical protein
VARARGALVQLGKSIGIQTMGDGGDENTQLKLLQ